VDEFRQGTHTGHVFNFGKDTDIRSPGFFQRMAQGQNICFAAHKRQHHTGNTALLCNFQVLQVFLRQGRRGHRKARCSNAFAALQGAAAHHGAHKGFRQCLCDLHQKLAVVQQKLLSGRSRLYQSCRARYAVCAKAYRAALNQSNRLCQRADAQFRPLQVDQQLTDAGCADHGQPVGVRRQRPVGKIHADAGHAGFHHVLQDRRLCAGRADGTIKIQGSFPRFIFYF